MATVSRLVHKAALLGWELPQNLLGAANLALSLARGGVRGLDHDRIRHSVQSRRLGPLYLPLVGVPSVARVAYAIGYRTVTGRRWGGYYEGWPERQADELGGVNRSLRPAP